jgi:hypothetical protein
MALIFIGKTKCALCGKVFTDSDNTTGLPPSSNKEHPLYKYFDAGFHTDCFENWDMKNEILDMIDREKREFEQSDYYKEMTKKHGAHGQTRKPDNE